MKRFLETFKFGISAIAWVLLPLTNVRGLQLTSKMSFDPLFAAAHLEILKEGGISSFFFQNIFFAQKKHIVNSLNDSIKNI